VTHDHTCAARPQTRMLAATAAVAVVLALDVVIAARDWPLVVLGAMDELAHLATAWLFLTALLPGRWSAAVPWALGDAVVIDLDHVPLYLWGVGNAMGAGRPVTHSLAAVMLLLAAAAPSRRLRLPLCGLALGLLLHLIRDVATGPGVPLLWPLAERSVITPYENYVVALCLVTAGAVIRTGRRSMTTDSQPAE
jgi:inner membrane protein